MERDASPWGGGGMDWASLPGKARADLPQSVAFNGRDVAIYTFAQIDRLGKKTLKERCMNMRDLVGASKLPRFSPGMQDEQMVAWLLEAQIIVANACGFSLTVADLGAPKGGDGVGAFLTHLQNAPSPPPPPPPQYQPPPPPQPRQPPPLQQPEGGEYDVERILDVRTDATGMASHFLIKWLGYGVEEATWEPAAQMQAAAPHLVVQFKQQFLQQQQQQRHPPPPQQFQSPLQQQYQQPPQQFQQRQQYQQPQQQFQQRQQYQQPPPFQQQQYQPTDLRGNPLRSPQAFSPPAGSPMRPDQEADMAREAARKRNMGSNPFG